MKRFLCALWLFSLTAIAGFGLPVFLLGWDCDDIALANYRIATALNLNTEIRYQVHEDGFHGHVWVAVEDIDIHGGSRVDGTLTLQELLFYVQEDK